MAQTTSPDNIPSPDLSDQYALTQDMANMADATQNALIKRANSYIGTSSQRTAWTTAPVGTLWSDTNGTQQVWRRGATSWEALVDFEEVNVSPSQGAGTIKAMRFGRIVSVSWSLSGTFSAGTAHQQFATTPLGFRPGARVPGVTWLGSANYGTAALLPDGRLYFINNTGASRADLQGTLTFTLP